MIRKLLNIHLLLFACLRCSLLLSLQSETQCFSLSGMNVARLSASTSSSYVAFSVCPQSPPPAQQSSSPAPRGRLTAFPWPGAAMAFQNVKMAVMKTTVPSVLPSSSDVTKEAASMLKGAATENWTVLITLTSATVKVGSLCCYTVRSAGICSTQTVIT